MEFGRDEGGQLTIVVRHSGQGCGLLQQDDGWQTRCPEPSTLGGSGGRPIREGRETHGPAPRASAMQFMQMLAVRALLPVTPFPKFLQLIPTSQIQGKP